MLARAVAGEAGVPFLFASGSQFDEMFVVCSLIQIASLHIPWRIHRNQS